MRETYVTRPSRSRRFFRCALCCFFKSVQWVFVGSKSIDCVSSMVEPHTAPHTSAPRTSAPHTSAPHTSAPYPSPPHSSPPHPSLTTSSLPHHLTPEHSFITTSFHSYVRGAHPGTTPDLKRLDRSHTSRRWPPEDGLH